MISICYVAKIQKGSKLKGRLSGNNVIVLLQYTF